MKSHLLPIFLFFLSSSLLAQTGDISLVAQANFGYTFVDISKAVDVPEYNSGTDSGLEDWDNFNFNGFAQILFNTSKTFSWGIEAGMYRIYRWLGKEHPIGLSPRWNGGAVWTFHAGPVLRWVLSKSFYFYTGADLHLFIDESSLTAGIKGAIGYEISLSKSVTMPIEFRTDVIFGNATPIAIGGGIGFKFDLK
ncbi:MAG: hypothetical protein A2V66_11490 [Ignavibacteria bacterium RBG_13_36_8]|nr:MAG: hypothetical protein A2V66_11490 [Ignavibacteria bacterium RBG_13_36_8]